MPLPKCVIGGRSFSILTVGMLGLGFATKGFCMDKEQQNLQLEVVINDSSANMISSFVRLADGRIGASRNELVELGLQLAAPSLPTEIVILDDIPSLKYAYDEKKQRILINIDNAFRAGHVFDLRGANNSAVTPTKSGWGGLINYDLLGTTGTLQQFRPFYTGGASLTLDGRAFSPFGTFEQSGIIQSSAYSQGSAIRLNTSFRYSDQDRLITYNVGDAINGGLAWTRPIRIGGMQAQSSFALRPDLITMPLPNLGGTAAVPSTVDVYVNNIRTFSQEVGAGPFSINNVPLVSGAGSARLVIRDSSGHETNTTVPFYASASLLAPGLSNWSLEAGLPRLSFGSANDAYVGAPIASASLRRGIFDWMTAEGHLEGGSGVANGGVGVIARVGHMGIASAAVSASTMSGSTGLQTFAAYETQIFGLNISAMAQHTFGSYNDLASATARLQSSAGNAAQSFLGVINYAPYFTLNSQYFSPIYAASQPPRSIGRFTVGLPLPFDDKANLSTSFVHLLDGTGYLSNFLTATYSRALPYDASLFVSILHDFGPRKSSGIFAGFSVPLNDAVSLSSNISTAPRSQGGNYVSTEASKALGPTPGSFGWRVRDAEGATSYREASISYRSNYATVQGGASQTGHSGSAMLDLRGSVVTMGGNVFLSNWIDDAFAVVDAGASNVEVFYENRSIGTTDSKGMLLVPTLRSYQSNKISVDPANLPIDAEVKSTAEIVAPANRGGVLVNFHTQRNRTSALVVFVYPDGSHLPPGAEGRIDGGNEFLVGYDGEAFIKNLGETNTATIENNGRRCRAEFKFAARTDGQVRISPVECRGSTEDTPPSLMTLGLRR